MKGNLFNMYLLTSLNRRRFFAAYLDYFTQIIKSKGIAATVEQVVFSPELNIGSGNGDNVQPAMLSRFLASALHPLIHTGYGFEFNLPGMVAEGKLQFNV
jgi:hypothetical protein